MNRKKDLIVSAVFCLILGAFFVFHIALPDEEVSASERRRTQQFPEISVSSLMNGRFMSEFEKYLNDQFPFRDSLRKIKAAVHFRVLSQKDNRNVYTAEGHIGEFSGSINVKSVENFTSKITSVYDKYIKNSNCKVYYSIIPDKNRFIAKQNSYPCFDYNELYEMVDKKLSYMTKIEIDSLLSADCYYRTDSHWKQEKILPVAEKINTAMGHPFNSDNKENKLGEFHGVYYPRLALKWDKDELITINNKATQNSITYNYENKKESPVYNSDFLSGDDAYQVFLSGSVSHIEIINKKAEGNKELVIFRDSFGSSLAPLLLSDYSKVTLVDTRYIMPSYLSKFLTFDNQDVLFIYSTMLVNNSELLK